MFQAYNPRNALYIVLVKNTSSRKPWTIVKATTRPANRSQSRLLLMNVDVALIWTVYVSLAEYSNSP